MKATDCVRLSRTGGAIGDEEGVPLAIGNVLYQRENAVSEYTELTYVFIEDSTELAAMNKALRASYNSNAFETIFFAAS